MIPAAESTTSRLTAHRTPSPTGARAWERMPGGVGRFKDPRTEAAFRDHQAQNGHRAVAVVMLALAVLGTLAGGLDYLRLDADRFHQASILRTVYVLALLFGAWLAWQRPSSYFALLPLTALLASATTVALLLRYDPEHVSVMGAALLFVFATLVFLNVVPSNAAIRTLVGGVNLVAATAVPWWVQGNEPEGRVLLAIALAWTSIILLWFSAYREERLQRQYFASTLELRHQAVHDPLTGLRNRRGFFEALDALVARHRDGARTFATGTTTGAAALDATMSAGPKATDVASGPPLARRLERASWSPAQETPDLTDGADIEVPPRIVLGMLDLDHFKRVNDRHGHDAGDLVLRALAKTLAQPPEVRRIEGVEATMCRHLTDDRAPVRPQVFRMGGEEFALILEIDHDDPVSPGERLEALIDAIRHLRVYTAGGQSVRLRASCGAVVIDPTRHTIDDALLAEALIAADRLLYRAKHRGRDRVYLEPFEPARASRDDLEALFAAPAANPP